MTPTNQRFYDVNHVAKEFDVSELIGMIKADGFEIYESEGEALISESALHAFLGARIRSGRSTVSGADAQHAAPSDYWLKFIRSHPTVADLLHRFLEYLADEQPDAHMQHGKKTITVSMPGGKQAGIWLRVDGLRMVCWRDGDPIDFWVRSRNDFEPALRFLRTLPDF